MANTGNISARMNIAGKITPSAQAKGIISSSAQAVGNMQQGFPRQHRHLEGRDVQDQHPESAITNLSADLAARPSEVITDAEIMAL